MRVSKAGYVILTIGLFFLSQVKSYANGAALDKPGMRMFAPEFNLEDIKEGTHEQIFVNLSSLKGKFVLLNFWSLDCLPCLKEMKSLDQLARKYHSLGLRVVTVSVNGSKEQIRDYYLKNNWSFIMLIDSQRKARGLYEVDVIPLSYLIGKDGRFVARLRGSRDWYSIRMRKQITQYLQGAFN